MKNCLRKLVPKCVKKCKHSTPDFHALLSPEMQIGTPSYLAEGKTFFFAYVQEMYLTQLSKIFEKRIERDSSILVDGVLL